MKFQKSKPYKLILSISLSAILLIVAVIFIDIVRFGYSHIKYQPYLSSRFLDRNGEVLFDLYRDEYRLWVPLSEIPESLQKATIAMEDHRFYSHIGVDPIAIGRAAKSTFIDKELEGGSTITQQFVKNAYLTSERTFNRKFREAFYALLLETVNTKQEILEKYLNEVGYGGVYYGVATASNYYFGKPVNEISLAEAATLAALTKAPTDLSPSTNKEAVMARQKIVLNKMFEYRLITEEEKISALADEVVFVFKEPLLKFPHFSLFVREELLNELTEKDLYGKGMLVTTTLDSNLQQQAQQAVLEEVSKVNQYNVTNGSAVVIAPKTGEVLAMVGSVDYFDSSIGGQYNSALAFRQPGSTFKAFTYAYALTRGYTPATVLKDEPTVYISTNQVYKPVNYDGSYHGNVSIRSALGNSYNIPATRMLYALGPSNLVREVQAAGFSYLEPDKVGLSLTLGGYEVRLLDLTAAYALFANAGYYQEPKIILSIKNTQGEELQLEINEQKRGKQVFSSEVSYLMADMLSDNSARNQAFGSNSLLNIPESKVAVKTGTTDNKHDNWAVGFNADFVVGVWVGNNNNTSLQGVASGLTGASSIWRKITDYGLDYTGNSWFDQPSNIVKADIDANTGLKYCGSGRLVTELFIKGTEPTECGEIKFVLVQKEGETETELGEVSVDEFNHFKAHTDQFRGEYAGRSRGSGELYVKMIGNVEDPYEKLVDNDNEQG